MKDRKFCIKIFYLLFILLTLIGCLYIRGTRNALITADYERINLEEYAIDVKGYETENFIDFMVSDGDPQILLDFTASERGKVKGIIINLNSEINLSSVQIYYGRESLDLSEADSEIMSGGKSDRIEVLSTKSVDGFRYIRLDINENFSVNEVGITYNYLLAYNDVWKYIFMFVLNVFFSTILAFSSKADFLWNRFTLLVRRVKQYVWMNRQHLLKASVVFMIAFGVMLAGEYIHSKFAENNYINVYRVIIFSCAIDIVLIAYMYKDRCLQYAHIYYFVIIIFIGTATIVTLPPTVGISADDEIHYIRTTNLSWGVKKKASYAEAAAAAAVYSDMVQEGKLYSHAERIEWENYINGCAAEYPILGEIPKVIYGGESIGGESVAYIPGAIGLILGRGLGFSFTSTFMLGKWMNLLCYSILFSLSIKIIKNRGKILVAVIGLIPTSLFMAASYSYDWWVISFTVLGYALCIREIQLHNEIRRNQLVKILTIMVIGLLPKAVYFPLLLPMMSLFGYKGKNARNNQVLVIGAMLVLIATFVLPMFLGTAGTGDSRGGADVNATAQIKFILNNPLQYTKILLGFLRIYLSPDNANNYLTYLLYYGRAEYYSLCLLVIGIVAVLDNVGIGEGTKVLLWQKAVIMFSCFASIVLVATALYVIFTPVASDTINGCQYRYILPVLFPFLFFVGKMDIDVSDNIKRKMFLISTSVMAFVFLYGIYSLRVRTFYLG